LQPKPAFAILRCHRQFARLIDAIAGEHPKQAALMRDYNDTAQRATLGHLEDAGAAAAQSRGAALERHQILTPESRWNRFWAAPQAAHELP